MVINMVEKRIDELIKILNNKALEEDQYVLDHKLIQRESCK